MYCASESSEHLHDDKLLILELFADGPEEIGIQSAISLVTLAKTN